MAQHSYAGSSRRSVWILAAFVITLSGEVEIGLGDGTIHRFGPGHVNLAEDLTGQGHTTRVVGDQPRVTAVIPLA